MNTGSQAIVSTVASILIVASPITVAGHDNQPPPQTEVDSKNIPNGTEFYGEVTEQVTEGGSSDSGEPPSQERPSVRASDPSMWEEQSHRECSPEKDAYGLDKYKCNLSTLNRPGGPDQPTNTDGGGRTVTVTTRQAATLIAQGSGITRQPQGPKVVISKALIVYTSARHPPLPAHRPSRHHHPDHHLDHPLPPSGRQPVAAHRGHHHHHRDLHPLRPGPHRHLPHRRRRRSPRPLTPTPSTHAHTPHHPPHSTTGVTNGDYYTHPQPDNHRTPAHIRRPEPHRPEHGSRQAT